MSKKCVYFVGVGGASMSALAVLTKAQGFDVFGCDDFETEYMTVLKKHNIKYTKKPCEKQMSCCSLVVASSAIPDNHHAIIMAHKLGVRVVSRGVYLASIASLFKTAVAVCGSHGKSTTTAFIFSALQALGKRPALHLGAMLCDQNTNCAVGEDFFVTEACEYKNNFRHIRPQIAVMGAVEYDHPDYFTSLSHTQHCFEIFAKNAKILICHESTTSFLKLDNMITFGEGENCNFRATNITNINGFWSYDVQIYGERKAHVKISTATRHDVSNSLSAFATLHTLGFDPDKIANALFSFKGIRRRFETLNIKAQGTLISDYAHHPTEIESSLKCFLRLNFKNKLIVFQPHTYSRTKALLFQFVNALNLPPEIKVVIYKTYPAREKFDKLGDGLFLCNALLTKRKCEYIKSTKKIVSILKNHLSEPSSCALLLGAGDLDSFIRKSKI